MLEHHLSIARRHVGEGTRHVTRQRLLVLTLDQAGNESSCAKALLSEFEQALTMQISHRDWLQSMLDESIS